jgi:PAS domain-containing protein
MASLRDRSGNGTGDAQAAPFTSHPVATLVLDDRDRIVSANPRAESLLNMARSALVGSAIDQVIRLADPSIDPRSGIPTSRFPLMMCACMPDGWRRSRRTY